MEHLASKIRILRARIDEIGEIRLEELQKHYFTLQELIDETSNKPDNYFTRVELIKKLNRIALKIQAGYASGTIKEEIKVFDRSLLSLKKFRLKSASEDLQELIPLVSIAEEHTALLQEYKKKYMALQNRERDLQEKIAEIETKQALFKAEACSEEEYLTFNTKLQSYNKSIAELLSDFITKAQSRKAISTMLDIYNSPELALPSPPKQAETLREFLTGNEIGRASIPQLLDLSRFSRDRLQYYLDDVKGFLEALTPNLPWLESLNSLKCKAALQINPENRAEDLNIKIPKLISAVSTIARHQSSDCELQIKFLRGLRKDVINGNFNRVHAKHFQKREAALDKIKSGEELKLLREELCSVEKQLKTIPQPSGLDR